MKRYFLFYASDFYASMGFNDFQGDFNSVDDCMKFMDTQNFEIQVEFHIYDSVDRKIVKHNKTTSMYSENKLKKFN